uniref:Uncharacterized protein n=1 Tax=Arundo donax TaxID=35708 RepID=A0A0A9E621_ARUDO
MTTAIVTTQNVLILLVTSPKRISLAAPIPLVMQLPKTKLRIVNCPH